VSSRNGTGSSRRMDRRTFLRLSSVSGGAALLAACGGTPAPQAGPTAAPAAAAPTAAPAAEAPTAAPAAEAPTAAQAAPAGDKTTLTFWTPGGSQTYCKGFATISEDYEKLHPNIDIAEVQCGTGDQNFKEVLLARIAAGNPPDSTIIWDSPIALGARGSLEALDDLMQTAQFAQKENWPAPVLASCQFAGKTWGLPVAAGTYAIWYNDEWFEEKGIPFKREEFPKTWDDLRRLSKEFTHWNGDTLETAGFIPWRDQYTLPIWSASNGGQIYNADSQKYTIDSEENIYMMQFALDWLNEEYKGDINLVNNSGAWNTYPNTSTGQPAAFQEKRLAMLMEGFWVVGDLYEVEVKFTRWNVASIPIGPTGSKVTSGYWPNWLAIPKGSKNLDEAFKWLDYMSGEGIKTWFANIPDMPANKKVPTDLVPAVAKEKRGEAFANDVTNFFRGQLDIATPMWDSPVQDFATDQISRAIEQIMNKQATPKDALAEAQKASQAELEKVLKGA
jgi:multiple sugar transport system substrate-binding protein